MSKTDTALTGAILLALVGGGWWLMDGWIAYQGWATWNGQKWAVVAAGWPMAVQAWPLWPWQPPRSPWRPCGPS